MAVGAQQQTNNSQASVQQRQRPSRGANSGSGQDFEKAIGFINIAVPIAKGQKTRVESIALKASNIVHQQIFDKLTDPNLTDEERAAKMQSFKDALVFDLVLPLSDEDKEVAF